MKAQMANTSISENTFRASQPSQRRTILHCHPGTNTQKHRRVYKWEGQVVEHLPAGSADRRGHIPGLVAEEIL